MKKILTTSLIFVLYLSCYSQIILSEIHYHPADEPLTLGDDLEFLEITNTGNESVNLAGYFFSEGIVFSFPANSLIDPSESLVLAKNKTVLESTKSITVFGQYSGGLKNSGETITLSDLSQIEIFSVTYDDTAPWSVLADGIGNSLEYKGSGDLNNADSWIPSANDGGSPGIFTPNLVAENFNIRINEITANQVNGTEEKIEIYNFGEENVDLSGWFLTDDRKDPKKYTLPEGTTLNANEYLTISSNDYGSSFGLSSNGEEVYLFSATDNNLTGFAHGFSYDVMEENQSYGSVITSSGDIKTFTLSETSFGSENEQAKVGPLVITNIMYDGGTFFDEFITIKNISDSVVSSNSPFLADSNGIRVEALRFQFDFNNPVTFEPGESFIITPAVPEDFRSNYNLDTEKQIFQCDGGLNSESELISIELPRKRDVATLSGGLLDYDNYYKTLDEVEYFNESPWYTDANGTGKYLSRINTTEYSNDPVKWEVTNQQLLDLNTEFETTVFSLHPTLSTDLIKITSSAGESNFTILNNRGIIVLTGEVKNNDHINISNIPSGLYFLTINSKTEKFIKF